MVKSVLLLLNFIGFLLYNLFFLQQIEVQQSVPERIAPGESVDVTVSVSKGKIQGFAKLQLNLDDDLTIEPVENNGASFTFSDQKAKFIWMSLPEGKNFELKYRLVVSPDASGPKEISGHFSYIDDNKRLVHDLQTATIITGETAGVADTQIEEPGNNDAFATVHREVEPLANGRIQVTLHIQKTDLTGFAKLQETISEDYTAAAINTEDAVFNVVNNQVKFVWFDITQASNLTVSYELIPVVDEPNMEHSATGEFSFLVNNETKSVTIETQAAASPIAETEPEATDLGSDEAPEVTFTEEETTTAEEDLAIEQPAPEPKAPPEPVVEVDENENWKSSSFDEDDQAEVDVDVEEESTEVAASPSEKEQPEVAEHTAPATPKTESAAVTTSAPTGTAISYRVQITAANKLVDQKYFEANHKYAGGFDVEHHKGWIKYTTGSFDLYRAARDHRNQLTQQYNFPGPFVTAYNDGDRITVQEALMIANQKWVP